MNVDQAIDKLCQVLRRQHKADATENAYVHWLRHYIKALRQMPPDLTSRQKVEHFLSSLACNRDVAASTQNQALNAILFFYKEVLGQPITGVESLRAKRPAHVRHAPSPAETETLLLTIPDQGAYPTNLIARLLYGCGLRVAEPLNLRIKDVNLERGTLCIRDTKGGKDRVLAIPPSLVPELRQQIQFARALWLRDCQNRLPVMLPHQLARKFPEFQFSWSWAWLFPAHRPCLHPRTGTLVRYRMHQANLQRAVKIARQKLGLSILPHELRHAYATDSLMGGTNPRAIQQAMGHKSLETTMGYLHAESLSVPSPLEALPRCSGSRQGANRLPSTPATTDVILPMMSRAQLHGRSQLNSSKISCSAGASHRGHRQPAGPAVAYGAQRRSESRDMLTNAGRIASLSQAPCHFESASTPHRWHQRLAPTFVLGLGPTENGCPNVGATQGMSVAQLTALSVCNWQELPAAPEYHGGTGT